jgi:hypothetical protein
MAAVILTRRAAWFLVAVGGWTWLIWPRFLLAIWNDQRSWAGDVGATPPTSFLVVHVVLVVVSLAVGTAVGWLGVRGLRALRHRSDAGVRVAHDGHDERLDDGGAAAAARAGDRRL